MVNLVHSQLEHICDFMRTISTIWISGQNQIYNLGTNETNYSRMDQVKIMEESLSRKSMACFTLFIFEYFDTNVPPIKIIILLELTKLT